MRYAGVLAGLLCVTSGSAAWAGPVVRQASGPTAARSLLTEGEHVVQVVVTFADQTSRRNAARWSVIASAE